ncbi:hypothetical protein AHiyo1_39750 [Arthrobacter sp. Hiyo1]|nr:hypothetical protein AHiyo1_39750 [Arthrobacter sp. Hiyo1]
MDQRVRVFTGCLEGLAEEERHFACGVPGEDIAVRVDFAQLGDGCRDVARQVEPAGADKGNFQLVRLVSAHNRQGEFSAFDGRERLRLHDSRGEPDSRRRLVETGPQLNVVGGGEQLGGALVMLDAFNVVVAHESHVSHHPGHFACELRHRMIVHLVVHGLAIRPGLVQPATLGQCTDQARCAPMIRVEPLGSCSESLTASLACSTAVDSCPCPWQTAASIWRARTPGPQIR